MPDPASPGARDRLRRDREPRARRSRHGHAADVDRNWIERQIGRLQRYHAGHGRIFRVAWVLAASTVVLTGLAMTVLPGPAVVVLAVGLAMLAMEFAAADRLLRRVMRGAVDIERRMAEARRTLLVGLVLACLVAAAVTVFVLR